MNFVTLGIARVNGSAVTSLIRSLFYLLLMPTLMFLPATALADEFAGPQPSENTGSIHPTNSLKLNVTPTDAAPSDGQKRNQEVWDHVLPFGAQQAIYNGYDLPLPFGISFLYTNVKQHQDISNMKAGFNYPGTQYSWTGRNGSNHIFPHQTSYSQDIKYDTFHFNNFYTKTHTPQLKIDAWVLPFLNLFATVGKIKGDIDLDMHVGGAQLINAANNILPQFNGKLPDCSNVNIKKRAQCQLAEAAIKKAAGNIHSLARQAAQRYGHDYDFSAEGEMDGYNYTLGMLLAGGSSDWFYTVPISYTQSRMKKTNIDGNTINIQPRIGYNYYFNHDRELTVYTGISYMEIQQTISGSYHVSEHTASKDTSKGITFQVEQENSNPWAGIIGFNFSLNDYFSAAMEYSGLVGDRKQFLIMLNGRF